MIKEGEPYPAEYIIAQCKDPALAKDIARMMNRDLQFLPDDVSFNPVGEILTVGEQNFSLAFLRFFGRHSVGQTFKIVESQNGIAIETVKPDA